MDKKVVKTDKDKFLREQIRDQGDVIARTMQYETIEDAVNDLNYKMNKAHEIAREQARDYDSEQSIEMNARGIYDRAYQKAGELVNTLLLKCFYQEIESSPVFDFINFTNKFDDIKLAEGNSKEYIFDLLTGVSSYNKAEYIPNAPIDPKIQKHVIEMYDSTTMALAEKAYQFRKRVSIMAPTWLPYFKSNNLAEFIEIERAKIRKAYQYFKFDQLMGMITSNARALVAKNQEGLNTPTKTAPGGRLVKGTTSNAFEAISKDIYPILNDLITGDANAAFGGANLEACMIETQPSDVIMIMSNKLEAVLRSGINSQLFNSSVFDLKKYLDEGNVKFIGNQIKIPGAKQWGNTTSTITHELTAGNEADPIMKLTTPYIDDNTIIIFHKDFIKHLNQIQESGSQYYVNNLITEFVLHVWATWDILPWCPFIVYHNPNLNVLPNEEGPVSE